MQLELNPNCELEIRTDVDCSVKVYCVEDKWYLEEYRNEQKVSTIKYVTEEDCQKLQKVLAELFKKNCGLIVRSRKH